jgi:hypothetical protein
MAEAILQAGLALTAASLTQPGLLPDEWPDERPELVELVRKKRPLHTAKTTSKDALLCRAICVDMMVKSLSIRQIALKYGVGRETVTAIAQLMEERGELRPLSQSISDGLGECIVLMMLSLREALLRGEVSPSQIPIPMAALIDKKAQLDAGLVPGTNRTEAECVESQQAAAWRALKAARDAASDSEASARSTQTPDGQPARAAFPGAATGPATGNDPIGPTLDLEPTPSAPASGAREPAQAREGGGGIAMPPPAPTTRGDGPENFGP